MIESELKSDNEPSDRLKPELTARVFTATSRNGNNADRIRPHGKTKHRNYEAHIEYRFTCTVPKGTCCTHIEANDLKLHGSARHLVHVNKPLRFFKAMFEVMAFSVQQLTKFSKLNDEYLKAFPIF